ncbi:MAG: acyl-CoA/acyl-ACP dehydrogenase [bacterium]|nr:acyl-CoA dehydrogenase [Deltaproteobacteria bacterium]MCP4907739.1 acyl-CoA/acyl-ACP dehydrogenase [bacterium]
MDLDFTEEHEMLREMVRGVCAEYAPLEVIRDLEDDAKGYPDELWKQLIELGLVGILVPEAYGGQEQSLLEAAIVYEEFGRALAPVPHFHSAVLCAGVLVAAGSEEQKESWLPGIASGERILTPAWLEPRNGFGAKGVQMRAEVDGADFVLSGTKLHVNFATAADQWLVLARTGEAEEAVDLFLVDPRAEGVTCSQRLNLGSETTYRVELDKVRVRVGDRIGAAGTGWSTWHGVMNDAIVLAAAQAAGGAKAALEMTIEYAQTREQFGKPLGAFQSISHYLADAATSIEGGATLVTEAAWARSMGKDITLLAPMAKLFMCHAYRDITAMCQQVWGGVGFTIEYDIQLYFRRAKQLQISWWDDRYLSELVAAQELD